MPCTLRDLEARERQILAPFAQFSADSRGRRYQEDPPEWRTEFQRDRDRIVHSRAFRRLEYKTQVFLNGTGDHLRTRLTHSMEVAAISRNIARALRINEDLAEAIALAHDLGHSPFGHTGEQVLDRLMKEYGGFEHNRQSLRVVEELEQKYPGFPGLNLTWEVREGLAKHHTDFDHPEHHLDFDAVNPSLEAQVANLADEIAYYSHDLDDGLSSGLLSEKCLRKEVALWAEAEETVLKVKDNMQDESRRYFIIRCLIDAQVKDVVYTIEQRIQDHGNIHSADDVRRHPEAIANYSPNRQSLNQELRKYLYKNLYFNPEVHTPHTRAIQMLEELFVHLKSHHEDMDPLWHKRARKTGWPRALCDYLAGMTDRYAMQEYLRLIGFRKNPPI